MASILVVDDDPHVRHHHQVGLEPEGHSVTASADGLEALSLLRATPPDVVVCDAQDAELGAWTLLQQIKADADPAVSGIGVVVVADFASVDDEIRGGIEGAIRCLAKPVSPDDLCRAVHQVLTDGPELEQRRRAQAAALERLARLETGNAADVGPRIHLTRLERSARRVPTEPDPVGSQLDVGALTEKQQALLGALRQSRSVSVAATELGVSRSNVYASLRRITRKLDVGSVQELLHVLRTEQLQP